MALTCLSTLPQLKSHVGAALNVGCTPLEIREVIYQCAPVIGYPKTFNAVATANEVLLSMKEYDAYIHPYSKITEL